MIPSRLKLALAEISFPNQRAHKYSVINDDCLTTTYSSDEGDILAIIEYWPVILPMNSDEKRFPAWSNVSKQ